jgi:hypothetical protein
VDERKEGENENESQKRRRKKLQDEKSHFSKDVEESNTNGTTFLRK